MIISKRHTFEYRSHLELAAAVVPSRKRAIPWSHHRLCSRFRRVCSVLLPFLALVWVRLCKANCAGPHLPLPQQRSQLSNRDSACLLR